MPSSKRALFKNLYRGLTNYLRKTRRDSESSIKSWKLTAKKGSRRKIMETNLSMICWSKMYMLFPLKTLKKSTENSQTSLTMLKTLVHPPKLLKIMIF
jgi:hypothetical protein